MKKVLKLWLSIVLIAAMVISVAACSKPNTASQQGTKTQSTAADDSKKFAGQTIRYVAANHMWNDSIKGAIPDFEKQTGINVSLESYAEDQLTQKLTIEFTSGNATIDAFMTRPLQEGKLFFKNNWYAPLDSYVNDTTKTPADWNWNDFMKANVKATTEGGKLVAIPLVNECETLFYRKDLFDQAKIQPPTTLDELEAAAKKLHNPSAEMYGIVSRGNLGAAVTQFSSYLYGFGGDFIKDGKSVVDSPEAVKAFQFYGRILHDYGPPGVVNMSWPQAVALFASGKAAMYTDASVMLAQMTDPSKSKIAGNIGVTTFPAGPAGQKPYMITSWALAIPEKSKHKDAAWEFIKWSTNKQNMTKGQIDGVSQTRNSVWSDPAVTAKLIPGFEAVSKKSAEIGVPYDRPIMVSVVEARDAIGEVIVKSITNGGTGDIAGLAKEAARKMNEMLQKAGEGGK